jgi:hypothetical protein
MKSFIVPHLLPAPMETSSRSPRHPQTEPSSFAALVAAVILLGACAAQAQYTEIDLGSQINGDLRLYGGGSNYQLGGSQLTVGGVPFGLATLSNNPSSLGIVQSPFTHNAQAVGDNGLFNFTFAVPAGIQATTIYSLMNSSWGSPSGTNIGKLVVTGTLGETATLNLVIGANIRDHYNNIYVNTLSDGTVVSTYFLNQVANSTGGPDRLDRQQLILPASFAGDTISTISFQGFAAGFGTGNAFLAGLTLVSVPEPTTLGLLALGATALLFRCRRKSVQ